MRTFDVSRLRLQLRFVGQRHLCAAKVESDCVNRLTRSDFRPETEAIEGMAFLSIDIFRVGNSESHWETPVVVLLKVKKGMVTISDAMEAVKRMKQVLNR